MSEQRKQFHTSSRNSYTTDLLAAGARIIVTPEQIDQAKQDMEQELHYVALAKATVAKLVTVSEAFDKDFEQELQPLQSVSGPSLNAEISLAGVQPDIADRVIDSLRRFINENYKDKLVAVSDENTAIKIELKQGIEELLKKPIEILDLLPKTYWCLRREGLQILGDVITWSADDLLDIRNLGQKSQEEIIEKLAKFGLTLADRANNLAK